MSAPIVPGELVRHFSLPRGGAARLLAVETLAFTDDPAARDALIEIAKAKGPTGKEALRWLLHLAETRWKDFDIFTLLREHGLLDLEN